MRAVGALVLLVVLAVLAAAPASPAGPAGPVTVSGLIEVSPNPNNGLNRYYLVTAKEKYRVWCHILDPDLLMKERLLENAAANGVSLTITGELDESGPEIRILIKAIEVKK